MWVLCTAEAPSLRNVLSLTETLGRQDGIHFMGARQSRKGQKMFIQMENIKVEPDFVTQSHGCGPQGLWGPDGEAMRQSLPQ